MYTIAIDVGEVSFASASIFEKAFFDKDTAGHSLRLDRSRDFSLLYLIRQPLFGAAEEWRHLVQLSSDYEKNVLPDFSYQSIMN